MKKLISLIGLVGLSLIMSFGSSVNQTSASSISGSTLSDEVTPLAISRYVVHEVVYDGFVKGDDSYYYSDSLGYSGRIPMVFAIYVPDVNKTSVRYAGTVYCSGVCAASQPTLE
ncbi:MAG: hypothetical protein ABS939_23220 [Psychrobacillus sp.]|uniref:hypothetical protein n=1 Tax=Solibacillus sp. FSL R7-0682 TaxID=2921690 RepID=UPI0030F6F8CF